MLAELNVDGAVDDAATYTVATISWVAGGGDGYAPLAAPESLGATTFDAVDAYLAAGRKSISP